MKTPIIAACVAFTVMFAADASAALYKCVKDGKTTYQEQPCGGQGGAETKVQTFKPSSWVGCYHSEGPMFDGVGTRHETIEVRQEGSTLYSAMGRDGPYEERLLWAPATPRQLRLMKEAIGGKQKDGIEVTSGLFMSGAAKGPEVHRSSEDQSVIGYWWIRGLEIDGDPMGHLPRTKETLRTSEKILYLVGPGTFQKANKVPCGADKMRKP